MHRSPLHHDRCFTLISGTADPGSPLHSLCGDVSILSMILHLVLPEWRRQAQQIDLFDAAKNGWMSELQGNVTWDDAKAGITRVNGKRPKANVARIDTWIQRNVTRTGN